MARTERTPAAFRDPGWVSAEERGTTTGSHPFPEGFFRRKGKGRIEPAGEIAGPVVFSEGRREKNRQRKSEPATGLRRGIVKVSPSLCASLNPSGGSPIAMKMDAIKGSFSFKGKNRSSSSRHIPKPSGGGGDPRVGASPSHASSVRSSLTAAEAREIPGDGSDSPPPPPPQPLQGGVGRGRGRGGGAEQHQQQHHQQSGGGGGARPSPEQLQARAAKHSRSSPLVAVPASPSRGSMTSSSSGLPPESSPLSRQQLPWHLSSKAARGGRRQQRWGDKH